MTQLLGRPWGHGDANTSPRGDETANIVGLELEIACLNDYEAINRHIEAGLIECRDTAEANIQLEMEAQSDVEYELIFNADTPANVLDRLTSILDIRHDVDQYHHEVSCHVHMNRFYIENVLGLDEMDIYNAAEAVAPLIYRISGRNRTAWRRWSPCCIDESMGVKDRLRYINHRHVTPPSLNGDRYDLTNLSNNSTVEIRGFSNYYNFDYDLIKTYISLCLDLIQPLAVEMQGKDYKEAPHIAIKYMQRFISDHMEELNRFDLSDIMAYNPSMMELTAKNEAMNKAIKTFNAVNQELEAARGYISQGKDTAALRCLLNILDLGEGFTLRTFDLDNLTKAVLILMEMNQKTFKKAVWGA